MRDVENQKPKPTPFLPGRTGLLSERGIWLLLLLSSIPSPQCIHRVLFLQRKASFYHDVGLSSGSCCQCLRYFISCTDCSPAIPRRWELRMGLLISDALAPNLDVGCLWSGATSFPVRTGKDSRTTSAGHWLSRSCPFFPLLPSSLFISYAAGRRINTVVF